MRITVRACILGVVLFWIYTHDVIAKYTHAHLLEARPWPRRTVSEEMASQQTCREVAAVPPDKLPQKLSLFFADMACKVFDESRAPNTAPDEARVRDELVTPLQWMLCGRDPAVAFCSLEEHQTQANFCGKVFRGGEPAYFCKWVRRMHGGHGLESRLPHATHLHFSTLLRAPTVPSRLAVIQRQLLYYAIIGIGCCDNIYCM